MARTDRSRASLPHPFTLAIAAVEARIRALPLYGRLREEVVSRCARRVVTACPVPYVPGDAYCLTKVVAGFEAMKALGGRTAISERELAAVVAESPEAHAPEGSALVPMTVAQALRNDLIEIRREAQRREERARDANYAAVVAHRRVVSVADCATD